MKRTHFLKLLFAVTAVCLVLNASGQPGQVPFLEKQSNYGRMMVDGKPFLMLAGELGNSTASSIEYMLPLWDNLAKMHVNTVLVPVYWELMEPEEGKFDFTLVDSMISSATLHKMKIVFLWFGTWKNSMSCYAPSWVKRDDKTFPRARKKDGTPVEILTPFSSNNCDADVKAFTELMKHIKTFDANRTVIMMQVENEIGMIPEARDYSKFAEKTFNSPVPAKLMEYLSQNKERLAPELYELWKSRGMKMSGTWEEVFGKSLQTDEIFMAWGFAEYTNKVAAAGKNEYPLPMYVNAALIREGYKPGQYPSAGPLPHLVDVWKAAATSVDFLSPDIYFRNFAEWAEKYDLPGNPLFIPEVGNDQSMTQAFYAFGRHNAMGYSPFSIESVSGEGSQVEKAYDLLEQLSPLILANQGKGTMTGFVLDSASQVVSVKMGNYNFTVRHEYSWAYASKKEGKTPRTGGMIIMTGPEEYIIAGSGIIVTFSSASNDGSVAGITSLDEAEYRNGEWIFARRMNGDQSHQGRHMHLPGDDFTMQKAVLYSYR